MNTAVVTNAFVYRHALLIANKLAKARCPHRIGTGRALREWTFHAECIAWCTENVGRSSIYETPRTRWGLTAVYGHQDELSFCCDGQWTALGGNYRFLDPDHAVLFKTVFG